MPLQPASNDARRCRRVNRASLQGTQREHKGGMMHARVLRRGQRYSSALLPRVVRFYALGLALFSLSVAGPATAAPAPLIHVSTSSAVFPTTQVCASSTTPRGGVILGNVGDAPLIISSLTFSGPNADEFSVTQGCVGTLQPKSLCNLIITFTPKAAGTRVAFLNINS